MTPIAIEVLSHTYAAGDPHSQADPEMIVRYFDATIDGWRRISRVTGYQDSDFDGFHDEVSVSELPENFETWKQYDAGAGGLGMSFTTISADGG